MSYEPEWETWDDSCEDIEYMEIEFWKIVDSRPKAYKFKRGRSVISESIWIPKSVIGDIEEKKGGGLVVSIARWFADEEDLV